MNALWDAAQVTMAMIHHKLLYIARLMSGRVCICRPGALQASVPALHGARCTWPQDVQVLGQCHRPSTRH